jgi:hypothetical protein
MCICKTITDADDPCVQRRNACSGRPLPLAHRLAAVGSRVGSEPLVGRARPAARASSSRARPAVRAVAAERGVEEEEEVVGSEASKARAAAGGRGGGRDGGEWEAEAEARSGSPEAALPRICAAGRRGKEEKEEPRRQIRPPGKGREGGAPLQDPTAGETKRRRRRPPSAAGRPPRLPPAPAPTPPRGRGRRGLQRGRRPAARQAPRAAAAAEEESGSGVGVEPWRRAGAGGGRRRYACGCGRRRETGRGRRRAGGCWDADSPRMRSRGDLLHFAAAVATPVGAATVPLGAAK